MSLFQGLANVGLAREGYLKAEDAQTKREQMAADAAYQEERRKQEREEWARQATRRENTSKFATGLEGQLDRGYDSGDTLSRYGLTPQGQPQQPQMSQAPAQPPMSYAEPSPQGPMNQDPRQAANFAAAGPQAPVQANVDVNSPQARQAPGPMGVSTPPQGGLKPQGTAKADPVAAGVNRKLKALRDKMELVRDDPAALSAIQDSMFKVQAEADESRIRSHILMVSDEDLAKQLAEGQRATEAQPLYKVTPSKAGKGLYELTVGDEKQKISRAQLADVIVGQYRLKMDDPSGAALIAGVNKELAAAADKQYGRVKDSVKEGNDGFVAMSGRVSANAAASNAATTRDYKNAQIGVMDDEKSRRAEASGLQKRWDTLTPAQQSGAEGVALQREFNMLNVKNGGQVSLNGGRGAGGAGGKMPTLKFTNDQNGGYFSTSDNGTPAAFPDPKREFPYIPIGKDPRDDKNLRQKLDNAGVSMDIAMGATGLPTWAFRSADGKLWTTPQEAMTQPSEKPQAGLKIPSPATAPSEPFPRLSNGSTLDNLLRNVGKPAPTPPVYNAPTQRRPDQRGF